MLDRVIAATIIMAMLTISMIVALALYEQGKKLFTKNKEVPMETALGPLEMFIQNFTASSSHHIEVNAVLALCKVFADHPEAMISLKAYSQEVVGATMYYRVSSLAALIQQVQDKLAEYEQLEVDEPYDYSHQICALERQMERLVNDLMLTYQTIQELIAAT